MDSADFSSSEGASRSYMLRVVLALGAFGGVVISLLQLLQGDSLLTIIAPLIWAVFSVVVLYISRGIENPAFLSWLTVVINNFVIFPLIWIGGRGFEGPILLYYFVLLTILMLLIHRTEAAGFMGILFTILTLVLIFSGAEAEYAGAAYNSLYEKHFDFIFHLLFGGLIISTLIRIYYQRIMYLEHELDRSRTRDSLTGLYNRRRILELLKAELLRCGREQRNLGVVIIGLSSFPDLISRLGTHSGDILLRRLAHVIRSRSRVYDLTGRYSVSSFLCLLPGSSGEEATVFIRRIREEFDNYREENGSYAASFPQGNAHGPADSTGESLPQGGTGRIHGTAWEVSLLAYEDIVRHIEQELQTAAT